MNILQKILFLLFVTLLQTQTFAQKTDVQYLSGIDKDQTVEWDFFCTKGRNSGQWTKIPVPSNWELQGFGTYNYGRDKNKANEEGLYKYKFDVKPAWKDKNVFIVFEGSMTDTEVKINGKLAGEIHQGAFYRFKYDISKLLNYNAPNLLEVKVSKVSADTSVNRAERESDFWVFGGIFRPVYLEALPQQYIERTAVNARADGSFALDVILKKITDAQTVEGQIYTLEGQKVGNILAEKIALAQKTGSKADPEWKLTLRTQIDQPKLWTPETPNRYRFEVSLKGKQAVLHTVSDKFGFRTVEVRKQDGIYVNGQKIMFKGVNRHSFWPTSGRTTSKQISIEDVNLMKDMNMNAVRMSHYPPDKHFLEVCDSLGLFVLDELTGWQKMYDTKPGRKLVKELVTRDVNHPSIVLWDNGNEGGSNPELVADYALYDPQNRVVIHPWQIFNGTDTQHYKEFGCCVGSQFNGKDIFFPTEFLHGIFDGGHGAGLNDYWNAMLQNPLSAGGFLWSYADEGVVRRDLKDSIDVKEGQAPDGIVGPYHEKEGSFYTIKEIWSPVYIDRQHITKQFDGKLLVANRYHYTNLKQVRFSWKLAKLKQPTEAGSGAKAEKNGTITSPDVAPGLTGYLNLDLPQDWSSFDALYLTAIDPYGRELFTWSWPIQSPKENVASLIKTTGGKIKTSENADALTLTANGVEIKFSKANGFINAVTNNGKNISFSNGPQLATGKIELSGFKHYKEGNDYVLELQYKGDMKAVKWRMLPSGWLKLEYSYLLPIDKGNYAQGYDFAGINFDYPENKVIGMKWQGKGPYRVWKNRLKGMTHNTWEKKYNDTETGLNWNYPEFKGYHANMHWVRIETSEQPFTILTETDDVYLRIFTPKFTKGWGNARAPFPDGNISFLHAISAIGNKFSQAAALGPEGAKNISSKPNLYPISGILWFNFGQ